MGHFLDRVERGTVPDQLTENPKERNVRTMQDIMADNKREGVKMPSVYGEIVKQGEKKDSAKKAQINKSTGAAKTTSSSAPSFPNTTIGPNLRTPQKKYSFSSDKTSGETGLLPLTSSKYWIQEPKLPGSLTSLNETMENLQKTRNASKSDRLSVYNKLKSSESQPTIADNELNSTAEDMAKQALETVRRTVNQVGNSNTVRIDEAEQLMTEAIQKYEPEYQKWRDIPLTNAAISSLEQTMIENGIPGDYVGLLMDATEADKVKKNKTASTHYFASKAGHGLTQSGYSIAALEELGDDLKTGVNQPVTYIDSNTMSGILTLDALETVRQNVSLAGDSTANEEFDTGEAEQLMVKAIQKYVPEYKKGHSVSLTAEAAANLEKVMLENGIPGYYVELLKTADKSEKLLEHISDPYSRFTQFNTENEIPVSKYQEQNLEAVNKTLQPEKALREQALQGYENWGAANEKVEQLMPIWKSGLGNLMEVSTSMAPNMLLGGVGGAPGAFGSLGASFVGSAGTNARQAKLEGATPQQAAAYAMIMGTVDAGTEKISGISTPWMKGGLDEAIERGINKNIQSRIGRGIAQWIAGAAGEGTEEAISAAVQPWVKHITYDAEAPIDYSEVPSSFALGSAAGAMFGSVPAAINIISSPQATAQTNTQPQENGVDNTITAQYNRNGGMQDGRNIETESAIPGSDLGGYRGISPDGQVQQERGQGGRVFDQGGNYAGQNKSGNSGQHQLLSERTVTALRNRGREPVPMRHARNGEEFHTAISQAKQTNAHGAYVTAYDAADYGNMKTFLSDNGKTGIAVKPDGDIVSVFNAPDSGHKKATNTLLPFAIENGGNKLDNYDGKLSELYEKFGFEPVAKVKFDPQYAPADWNYERDGQPDIIFWRHNGDSADVVAENIGNYPIHDLSQVPYFDSYDEAAAYRDSLIEQSNNIADSADTGSASFIGGNTTDIQSTSPIAGESVTDSFDKQTSGKKAGEVTTIYSPYEGETPVQTSDAGNTTITVSQESVQNAASAVEQAKNNQEGVSLRSALRKIYESLFDKSGGAKHIPVKNMTFGNVPYVVDVNKNAISKVISDKNLTVEKLSLLDNLNAIIENGKYVGSGNYVQKGKKVKDTIRFDYFETPVRINGKDYIATFDVEVFPNTNQYRTHKVIEKMDLIALPSADTGPVPAANESASNPTNSIPQNGETVNGNFEQQSEAKNNMTVSDSYDKQTGDLTTEEKGAILRYKGGGSYTFNDSLRAGKSTVEQEQLKQSLNVALDKMPRYEGKVYRNIGFWYEEDFNNFIVEHSGNTVTYDAFTSTSKSPTGYEVEAPYLVHAEIESRNGRDLMGLGTEMEEEVLFKTDSTFQINKAWRDGNTFYLILEEVAENGNSNRHDAGTVYGSMGSVKADEFNGKRSGFLEKVGDVQGGRGQTDGISGNASTGSVRGNQQDAAYHRDGSGKGTENTLVGKTTDVHGNLNENADRWGSNPQRWQAETGESNGEIKSLSEIMKFVEDEFGIPIGTGNISQAKAKGVYKTRDEAVRTRVTNALPTVAHELGHHLDKRFGISSVESISEIINELPDKMKAAYSNQEIPGEAVAEFIREYLTDSGQATEKYPNFYQDFKKKVGSDTRTTKAILELADMVHGYMSADSETRLGKAVGTQFKGDKLTIKDIASGTYERFVDDALVAKQIDEAVEKKLGRKLTPDEKFYVRVLNERGSSTIVKSIVEDKLVDMNGEVVGDSLSDVLQGLKKDDIAAFNQYLVVKHAQSWLTPDENGKTKRVFADDTLNNLEFVQNQATRMEQQHPEFVEAAQKLYEYQNNLMQTWLVDSGLMAQETMNALREKYPYYVPLKRKIGKNSGSGKAGYVNQKSPLKRAHGSGAEIIDPLESIVANTDQFVNAAKRNEVMQTLTKLYDEVEGLGQWLEEIAPGEIDKRKTTVSIENQKNKLKKTIGDYVRQYDSEGNISFDELIDNILGDSASKFTPVVNSDKRIVSVMQNGESRYFKINDKDLYNLVTANNAYEVNPIIKMTYVVAKMFKLTTTGVNPMFGATNVVKDVQTAILNSPTSVWDVVKRLPKSALDVIKNSEDYKLYKRVGGGYNTPISGNKTNFKRTMRELYDTNPNLVKRAMNLLAHPLETIEDLVNFTEVSPRLATFKSVLNKTDSTQGAIFEANDVTVNFQKRGRYTQGIETLQPYFNAKIQGLDKAIRQYKAHPVKTAMRQAALLLPSIFALALIAKDDEAKEDYARLSSYQKNRNFNFWIGDGKFIKIPKGETYTALNSLVERAVEAYFFENEDAFYDMGDYLWDTFVPAFDVGNIPIFGNFYDLRSNKDFMDRSIVPANLENLKKSDQYDDSTTWVAKKAGELTKNLPEPFQLSPKQVDYVINKNTGFIGQINKALGTQDKDITLGLKSKFKADSLFSNDVSNRFYEQKDEIDKSYNSAVLNDTLDGTTAYRHSQYAEASTVLSQYNKLIKAESNQTKKRQLKRDQLEFLESFKDREESPVYAKLYEMTNDTKVFPRIADVSIKYNDKEYTLTEEERQKYQETMDKEALDLVTAISKSSGFSKLSDEDKVKQINAAQSYADAVAKNEVLKKKDSSGSITFFKQDISNKKKYYSIWSEVEPDNVEKQARGKAIGEVSSVVNALSQKSKLTPTVISGINKYVDKIESRSAKAVDKELYRLGVLKEDYTDTENGNIGVSGSYMSLFEYTDDGQKYSIKVNYSDMPQIMQDIETETYKQLEKLFAGQYASQKKKTYGQRYNYKNASADQKIKWVSEVKTDVRNQFKEKYKRKYGVTKVANKLKAVK